MVVTYQHLSGSFENTDKVIAWNLENSWTSSNTSSITPQFENSTDEPDYNAQFERAWSNSILVNSISKDLSNSSDEVNSDTVHSVNEEILITIVAESKSVLTLLENEVNRILWEIAPNSSTRLSKSDAADSHIDHFEKSEVTFSGIDLPDNDTHHLIGSEGSLICIFYKFKS